MTDPVGTGGTGQSLNTIYSYYGNTGDLRLSEIKNLKGTTPVSDYNLQPIAGAMPRKGKAPTVHSKTNPGAASWYRRPTYEVGQLSLIHQDVSAQGPSSSMG